MNTKPNAVIFRTLLLPASETFVKSQSLALTGYEPFFMGLKRAQGLELPAASTWVANNGTTAGKIREISFKLFGSSKASREVLRKLKPKLMHAHFGPDGCEAMTLAASQRLPLITTFHGYDATLKDEEFEKTLHGRRYLGRRANLFQDGRLFIAVSDFVRRRIIAQGAPENRTVVHYIGVDTEQFRPPQNVNREKCVLFVGRLVAKKGCAHLLKAMALVQSALPDVELVIIGDGPERAELEAEAQRTLQKFRFLGAQNQEVIRKWMHRATVFSVPSVTAPTGDSEGFGIVFTEAQASGLPVVSYASGGIPEAVAHGETGFLAPEGDWNKLAENILLLFQLPAVWTEFSNAGVRRVAKMFDLKKQTVILEDIYENVLSSRRSARFSQSRVASDEVVPVHH